MPNQTSKQTNNSSAKAKRNQTKKLKPRVSDLKTDSDSSFTDNALYSFLSNTYKKIRTQPEVDSAVRWVKDNPKKSVGIGLGLLLLTRSNKATKLAKVAFSTGAAGWIFNKVQEEVTSDGTGIQRSSSRTESPSTHLH